jgi:cell division septum initiation protein DivIVA
MLDSKPFAPPSSARSPRLRSRITNQSKMVLGLDGRSAEARRYRDIAAALADDLRGPAALSESQRTIVMQIATLQVQAERVQSSILNGERIDEEQFTRLSNAILRALKRLGIKSHQQRDATPSLSQYLAASAGDA